jgi:hypothetical protein
MWREEIQAMIDQRLTEHHCSCQRTR